MCAEPYGIYDRFDFNIPVLYGCDTYDREELLWDMIERAEQSNMSSGKVG